MSLKTIFKFNKSLAEKMGDTDEHRAALADARQKSLGATVTHQSVHTAQMAALRNDALTNDKPAIVDPETSRIVSSQASIGFMPDTVPGNVTHVEEHPVGTHQTILPARQRGDQHPPQPPTAA